MDSCCATIIKVEILSPGHDVDALYLGFRKEKTNARKKEKRGQRVSK
jgi:hypothetical protein